ncbi:GGDEF domain-containing response regulator, partial [Microcoleus sp. HI-ES]|nr:GGDEF domain-containing response regulator [Microcoleus sp. HI-ES]
MTKTLEEQNVVLKQEIEARKEVEAALQKLTSELEERVASQTAELRQACNELQQAQVQLLEREEKLGHDAFHDALTELPNRAWFMNRLQ